MNEHDSESQFIFAELSFIFNAYNDSYNAYLKIAHTSQFNINLIAGNTYIPKSQILFKAAKCLILLNNHELALQHLLDAIKLLLKIN